MEDQHDPIKASASSLRLKGELLQEVVQRNCGGEEICFRHGKRKLGELRLKNLQNREKIEDLSKCLGVGCLFPTHDTVGLEGKLSLLLVSLLHLHAFLVPLLARNLRSCKKQPLGNKKVLLRFLLEFPPQNQTNRLVSFRFILWRVNLFA